MTAEDLWMGIVLAWLFVLGSVIGSFLNVCVHRFPKHERLKDQLRSIWWPPSHCPRCKSSIHKRDNIPILGWILLKGRCRTCALPISARYPIIEFLNGTLFVLVYLFEVPHEFRTQIFESCGFCPIGPQILPDAVSFSDAMLLHWRYAYHMVLFEALLVASLIDIDTTTIPDGSTVPAMIVGIIAAGVLGQVWMIPVWFEDPLFAGLAPEWSQGWFGTLVRPPLTAVPNSLALGPGDRLLIPQWVLTHPHLHALAVSVVGLVVGGGVVWLIRIIGQLALRREALGFGDVILMGLVGSFLGWQATLVAFLIAPFCAMFMLLIRVIARNDGFIPYGPYLSLGTLLVVLFWNRLWPMVGHWFSTGPWVILFGAFFLFLMFPALLVTQTIKRALGFPDPPPFGWVEETWTAADQTQYQAGEFVDRDRQSWSTADQWPGKTAANGTLYEERWRNNGGPTGWPEP